MNGGTMKSRPGWDGMFSPRTNFSTHIKSLTGFFHVPRGAVRHRMWVGNNHGNEIPSRPGRNILCGSRLFYPYFIPDGIGICNGIYSLISHKTTNPAGNAPGRICCFRNQNLLWRTGFNNFVRAYFASRVANAQQINAII